MPLSWKQQQRDLIILQLLCALPAHPYDVERQLAALGYAWSTHGAVIRHLKLLAQEGLVASTWETPQDGRARLIYPADLYDHRGGYGLLTTRRQSTILGPVFKSMVDCGYDTPS